MAFNETINLGTAANNGTGDGLRTNMGKLIENDNYLNNRLDSFSPYVPKSYLSLAAAQSVDPIPEDGTPFTVYNPNDILENGRYSWQNGVTVKEEDFYENQIDSNNTTKAVTGQAVHDFNYEQTKLSLQGTLKGFESNFFSTYDGNGSKTILPVTYTLENDGDFVEFDCKVNDTSGFKGLGILGDESPLKNVIGFGTNNNLYVRNDSGDWITTVGFLLSIDTGDLIKVKLLWNAGSIDIYKDNVFQKTIASGIVKINNIGAAYESAGNTFDGAVKNIAIGVGGFITKIATPYLYQADNTNVYLENEKGFLTSTQAENIAQVDLNSSNLVKAQEIILENHYVRFNGSTAKTTLDQVYTLENDGDYIEITARFNGSTYQEGLGLFGIEGMSTNSFGFFNDSEIWFRADGDSDFSKVMGLSLLNKFSKYRLEVINNASEFEVFKDEISVGVFVKSNDFKIQNIGNAYTSFAKVDVKNIKINTSENSIDILNLYFSNQSSIDLDFRKENVVSEASFKKCYVTFDPVGANGNEQFFVYVQNESNLKFYYGFEIVHEVDASELVYMNQYRLFKANIFEFDGQDMIDTGQVALTYGESEFVYQTPGKVDFTGGYHGDEQLINVDFYIDGVRLTDLSTSFSLKSCCEFAYIQKSTMHESAATGDVVNPAHPIEAIHFKHSIFSKSGYKTINRLIWQNDLTLSIVYGSIVCLSTQVGGAGQTSNYEIETFDFGGGHKLSEINDNVHVWNELNKMSATVQSEFDVYNDSSEQFIWDTSSYNKYYRDIAHNGDITVVNGDQWNLITTVKFNKQ
jgi:hypothetical protein